ncbi:MAG: hypothetical protein ICV60_01820 [Pyrinomonadaceae bacterium]|nr:hypothetical protein [Pyrinomonadaceae bacterium]
MMKHVVRAVCGLILSVSLFAACGLEASAQEQKQNGGNKQAAQSQLPPAEATVTLNEQFLNSLLDAVFTNLRAPTFPLSLAKTDTESAPATTVTTPASNALAPSKPINQCLSQIILEREMSGVRTAVRFENGRITAPLAFTGTYNTGLLGCLRFQGWADTVINLAFNRERQTLNAQVDVVDIHLNGIPQLANGIVVQMVQNAIDQRINPIEILKADQLTTRLPIDAAGGALRLRAKDLRPEVVPGAIRLHIIYEFVRAE